MSGPGAETSQSFAREGRVEGDEPVLTHIQRHVLARLVIGQG